MDDSQLPTSTPSLRALVSQIRTLVLPYSSALSSPNSCSATTTDGDGAVGGGLSYLPASLPHQLQHLMRQYVSREEDFLPYAYFPTPDSSPAPPPPQPLPKPSSSSSSSSSAASTDTDGHDASFSSEEYEDASSAYVGEAELAMTRPREAACAPPPSRGQRGGGCKTAGYSRNLVDRGNGEYNLLVLCWPAGASSQIHDHPGAHCIVKMLSGRLREVRYRHPDPSRGEVGKGLVKTSDRVLEHDGVTYMHDKFGLHSMHNLFSPSSDNPLGDDATPSRLFTSAGAGEPAISLHLYSPPIPLCRVFDPMDGKAKVVDCQRMESVGGVRGICDGAAD